MFQGFSDATVDFMWNLRFHNERTWFLAHKDEFLEALDRPMKALAADVLAGMQAAYPNRAWNVRVSRIYRDARRLHGRGPYKDHLWFTLWCDGESGPERPAFYFECSPEDYSFGMGYYAASPQTMARFRRAVLGNPRALEKLADRFEAQNTFQLYGKDYARPKGDVGAKLNPWFNKRVIGFSCDRAHDALMCSGALVDELVRGYGFLLPYYDYLVEVTSIAD